MLHRKFGIACILVLLGIGGAIAILPFCSSFSEKASASNFPNALNSVPSDFQFVSGINVRRLAASSLYAKLLQDQPQMGQMASDLSKFTEQTGVDPARDLSYLVVAARFDETTKPEAFAIVAGEFDSNKIISYIRSKGSLSEMEYGSASILMIPGQKNNDTKSGIVFLSEHEIALGVPESLKAALDTRAGGKKSILSNAVMASLLSGIDCDDMFWFAGETANVLKNSTLSVPPNLKALPIQSIVGAFNITDDIIGRITASTVDSDSAAKLADGIKGLIALGQLSTNKNPDAKLLLDRVTVSQNTTQVTLSFNIPGDLIKIRRLGRVKSASMNAGGSPLGDFAKIAEGHDPRSLR